MQDNKEGQKVPAVTFKTREDFQWRDVTSDEIFSGKTVVVFSLPGAFTPTCSSSHVPRYDELAPVFKANGIDDIVCVSVNDAFVMNEWKTAQNVQHVRMLPDGGGKFTDAMGMLVNKDDLGFGMRSWRYSMLVRDGIIAKMFVEPQVPGDPFEVSDADTMLAYINPDAEKPLAVTLLTRSGCAFCAQAKAMLRERGIEFDELSLNKEISGRSLRAIAAADTFPQVFIDGEHIGGADELQAWLKRRAA